MEAVKRILRQLRGTPDLPSYSRNSNFKLIGCCNASYDTDNLKNAKSTSGSMHVLCKGSSTSASASSATTRGFAPSGAGQLQQSK